MVGGRRAAAARAGRQRLRSAPRVVSIVGPGSGDGSASCDLRCAASGPRRRRPMYRAGCRTMPRALVSPRGFRAPEAARVADESVPRRRGPPSGPPRRESRILSKGCPLLLAPRPAQDARGSGVPRAAQRTALRTGPPGRSGACSRHWPARARCSCREDIHWIDPSSAEVMAELLAAVTTCPLVVCTTRRPEGSPAVERIDRPSASCRRPAVSLYLEPLDDPASSASRRNCSTTTARCRPFDGAVALRRRCSSNSSSRRSSIARAAPWADAGRSILSSGHRPAEPQAAARRLDALPRPVRARPDRSVISASSPLAWCARWPSSRRGRRGRCPRGHLRQRPAAAKCTGRRSAQLPSRAHPRLRVLLAGQSRRRLHGIVGGASSAMRPGAI